MKRKEIKSLVKAGRARKERGESSSVKEHYKPTAVAKAMGKMKKC